MLGDKENFWCFTQNMGTTEYKFFAIASSAEQRKRRGNAVVISFIQSLETNAVNFFLRIEQFLQLHVYDKSSHLTTPDLWHSIVGLRQANAAGMCNIGKTANMLTMSKGCLFATLSTVTGLLVMYNWWFYGCASQTRHMLEMENDLG